MHLGGIVGQPDGRWIHKLVSMTGSGATVQVNVFKVVGVVKITKLYGIVTTTLGNHTAVYWDLWDGTAAVEITKSAGAPAMTGFVPGGAIYRQGLASELAGVGNAAVGSLIDPFAKSAVLTTEFVVQQKYGADTWVRYVYTTADTPTTGAIDFHAEFYPRSEMSELLVA